MKNMQILIHKGLTLERWCKFSLHEQLANVGCDVSRAIKGKSQSDFEFSRQSFFRALELLDLTILDPKHKGKGSLKELLRVREALIDYFMFDNDYKTNDLFWDHYFLNFNYLAAIEKGK